MRDGGLGTKARRSRGMLSAFIGALLLPLSLWMPVCAGEGLPAKGPYFPVDERIIEDRWHVERFVVFLERHPGNPVLEKKYEWEGHGPYAGTALRDPDDKLFKMWYVVFNEHNYPLLCRLFDALGVESRDSDMSFSVRCDRTGLEWNGSSLNQVFAQRRNLLRPSHWRMLADILLWYGE